MGAPGRRSPKADATARVLWVAALLLAAWVSYRPDVELIPTERVGSAPMTFHYKVRVPHHRLNRQVEIFFNCDGMEMAVSGWTLSEADPDQPKQPETFYGTMPLREPCLYEVEAQLLRGEQRFVDRTTVEVR